MFYKEEEYKTKPSYYKESNKMLVSKYSSQNNSYRIYHSIKLPQKQPQKGLSFKMKIKNSYILSIID